MADVKYRVAVQRPDPKWESPEILTGAMKELKDLLRNHKGGGFRIRERDSRSEFGQVRTLTELDERMRVILKGAHVGNQYIVRAVDDEFAALVRKIDVDPPVRALPGLTANADRMWEKVKSRFPDTQNWGALVCRDVGSTGSWSYHAWGQAIDMHRDTKAKMQAVANLLVRNWDHLQMNTVIFNLRIYSTEHQYWHPYDVPPGGSTHEDHVHGDVKPVHDPYTTPPCAK